VDTTEMSQINFLSSIRRNDRCAWHILIS